MVEGKQEQNELGAVLNEWPASYCAKPNASYVSSIKGRLRDGFFTCRERRLRDASSRTNRVAGGTEPEQPFTGRRMSELYANAWGDEADATPWPAATATSSLERADSPISTSKQIDADAGWAATESYDWPAATLNSPPLPASSTPLEPEQDIDYSAPAPIPEQIEAEDDFDDFDAAEQVADPTGWSAHDVDDSWGVTSLPSAPSTEDALPTWTPSAPPVPVETEWEPPPPTPLDAVEGADPIEANTDDPWAATASLPRTRQPRTQTSLVSRARSIRSNTADQNDT